MPTHIESYGLSDIGLVRTNNEDVWMKLEEDPLFIIADGLGGHRAGEVASREAVDALSRIVQQKFLEKPVTDYSLNELKELIYSAIIDVNSVVYSIGSSDESLRGMGTTLCCLCVATDGVVYAHIGDSRVYRVRAGKMKQLTKDHTLLAPYTPDQNGANDEGVLYKNFLTRTIGNDPLTVPDVESSDIQNGDTYLLCTDGLTDMLTDEEIERLVVSSPSMQDCAQELVRAAKQKGGVDNITVIVIKLTHNE